MLKYNKTVESNEDHKLGHLLLKGLAFGTNTAAVVMFCICWKFETIWDLAVYHSLFGPIPLHIGMFCFFFTEPQNYRELSIAHDYLCLVLCLGLGMALFMTEQPCGNMVLLICATGGVLFFDLVVHLITEDCVEDPEEKERKILRSKRVIVDID